MRGADPVDPDEEFTRWATEHSGGLLRRAIYLTGDRQHGEDLVQETLTQLYLHWKRIDRDGNPVGYAHTTLFRLFVSGRRRRSSTELPLAELPERSGRNDSTDLRLDLIAALKTLQPKDRCVVLARYVEGRSVGEVAELMRRSEGWVRTTAHRALHRLRTTAALSPAR